MRSQLIIFWLLDSPKSRIVSGSKPKKKILNIFAHEKRARRPLDQMKVVYLIPR